jgi:hypothetical protein
LLIEAGLSRQDAEHTVRTFAERDQQRLKEDYEIAGDVNRLIESARRHADDLAELFSRDRDERK